MRRWPVPLEVPADACSLLPTAVVNKTLNARFTGPEKKFAPAPYRNTAEGTDCVYKFGGEVLLFRIYVDPSPDAAKELFARLKEYFGANSTPASIGDEAYVDTNHGLHVRKGKVRFFIDGGRNDQMQKALANGIIAQL
ncbi:MAG: hypothetical protein JO260_01505 [Acidobacteria bacterium]|nr:hypothetical protein [Acidobacteriota bacterium]